MVAIVSGKSLGLLSSSLDVLGSKNGQIGNAASGRNGDLVYINAANGNLMMQHRDEFLASRGINTALFRTYNSQGVYTDRFGAGGGGSDDNFRMGIQKQVKQTGNLNTGGSSITRTEGDGSTSVYFYDSARGLYVGNDGDGAYDTNANNPGGTTTFTWIDGVTQAREVYNNSGLMLSATDADGNTTTYNYINGKVLSSVVMASGDVMHFDYSNDHDLIAVRTVSQGVTHTRMRYGYDNSHRLTSMTVDLSPEDNSVADGNAYTTTYTYDGSSDRVAKMTQADGTSLSFTYVRIDTNYRVASVTDGQGRVTRMNYDLAARRTDMTDPLGYVTSFYYDGADRLTQVLSPAVSGVRIATSYAYDANGNVLSITDGNGNAVTMQYDGNGNQVRQQDPLGNVVVRTFNATNHVLTESVRMDNGAAPLVTRYVYDSRNHLRFQISPEGRVTESRYDGFGQKLTEISYAGAEYLTEGMAESAVPTEAAMAAWAAAQDRSKTERADYTYDFRSQLASSTTYPRVDADGKGIADGSESVTRLFYDRTGRLVKSLDPRVPAGPDALVSSYTYDGLDRLLAFTNANGHQVLNRYDDAGNRTISIQANGLVSTSTYDRSGELTAVIESDPSGAVLGTARVFHDADGRLIATQDATGVRTRYVYDPAGRRVGTVDGTGALTENIYDYAGNVVRVVRYATLVDRALLGDTASAQQPLDIDRIRPVASSADRKVDYVHDKDNRLIFTIDETGSVTQQFFDAADRLTDVVSYATTIDRAALPAKLTPAAIAVTSNPADRSIRSWATALGVHHSRRSTPSKRTTGRFGFHSVCRRSMGSLVMRCPRHTRRSAASAAIGSRRCSSRLLQRTTSNSPSTAGSRS